MLRTGPRSARGPRRAEHDLPTLLGADGTAQIGMQLAGFTLPLLALYAADASAWQIGMLTACLTAPTVLLGLPVGAWVDRWPARPVIVVGTLGRALLLASLAVGAWSGIGVAALCLAALAVGTCGVFVDIAYLSLIPSLVPRHRLMVANGRLQAVRSASYASGPALGGILVQSLGAGSTLLAAATAQSLAALGTGRIRHDRPRTTHRDERDLLREVLTGMRVVTASRVLRQVLLASALLGFFIGLGMPMTTVLLVRDLGLPSSTVGLVLAASGVGGVVGNLVVGSVARRHGTTRTVVGGAALLAFPAALVPLAGPGPWLAAPVLGLLLGAVGRGIYNVAVLTVRQRLTPHHMLGRVNASIQVVLGGMLPMSSAASGGLATIVGARGVLWVSAAGAIASALWVVASPVARNDLDEHEPAPTDASP